MFCGFGEERKRFKKKKKKKLNAAKSVGRDERVFYNKKPCKNFFVVLMPFLNQSAFYTKLLGWFSGPKIKVRKLFTSKFGTNI